MRQWSAAALAVALAACSAPPPPESRQAGPAFDPIAFFTGASHGDATLVQLFKDNRSVTVDSSGVRQADGSLVLTQRIASQGEAPRTRVWRLRQIAPGRYTGALTDADGPVETLAIGRAIRIRYPMKGGLAVEQWLVALPGGRVLDNRLAVSKWGVSVATLHERIAKR